MRLEIKAWNQLSSKEINDIFSLRSEVFIVEQECIYQDVDGKDEKAVTADVSKKDVIKNALNVQGHSQKLLTGKIDVTNYPSIRY